MSGTNDQFKTDLTSADFKKEWQKSIRHFYVSLTMLAMTCLHTVQEWSLSNDTQENISQDYFNMCLYQIFSVSNIS